MFRKFTRHHHRHQSFHCSLVFEHVSQQGGWSCLLSRKNEGKKKTPPLCVNSHTILHIMLYVGRNTDVTIQNTDIMIQNVDITVPNMGVAIQNIDV